MRMVDGSIDTGQILLRRRVPSTPDETTGSLTEKLAQVGAEALMEALPLWIEGKLTPQPQDDRQASYTRMVRKTDGLIDWHLSADLLARQVRAYHPWPGAYTHWRAKLLKILAAHPIAHEPEPEAGQEQRVGLVTLRKEAGQSTLLVTTGEGMLAMERLQLEGKKAMSAEEFVRGYPHIVGDILG